MSSVAEELLDLVRRIETGDLPAESEFVRRYIRCVRRILIKRTASTQLANDLCQDTFVIALRKLRAGELENPRCLGAFVRQIASNVSIEYFRREKRYVHRDDATMAALVAHRDFKGNCIDKQTTRLALDDIIGQLPVARDREILCRFYLDDENKDQICKDLHLSSAHFDRVLYRARGRMRRLIMSEKGLKAKLCAALRDA